MNATLRNGNCIPFVGFGTFKIRSKEDVQKTIKAALDVGYRLIDTASVYRNEAEIGQCLKEYVPSNNLERSDIFITSKLGPKDQGEGTCFAAFHRSLSNLDCQYLDLYLIHWPGTQGRKPDDPDQGELRVGSWRDLIKLQKEGICMTCLHGISAPGHIIQELCRNAHQPCEFVVCLHVKIATLDLHVH
uniref:NADP-dependent oxidoreductase domain-containing protein n=1 Tax=Magallana gigas TaxID=29159 RepID=A0A8W8M6I8_MAGGI